MRRSSFTFCYFITLFIEIYDFSVCYYVEINCSLTIYPANCRFGARKGVIPTPKYNYLKLCNVFYSTMSLLRGGCLPPQRSVADLGTPPSSAHVTWPDQLSEPLSCVTGDSWEVEHTDDCVQTIASLILANGVDNFFRSCPLRDLPLCQSQRRRIP